MKQVANETSNDKRSRKILRKKKWLGFTKVVDRKCRVSYELEFYQEGNRKYTKAISYDEKSAQQLWNANYQKIPDLVSDLDKKQWIDARFTSPPKRVLGSKRNKPSTLGTSLFAKKLEEYCDLQWQKPIERGSKVTVYRICRDLLKFSGKNETLTPASVQSYFRSRMNPENHRSPETLAGDKTEIRRIAKWLGLRDTETLFKNIYFPTQAQLKDNGIRFHSHNRTHLERPEVLTFVQELMASTYNNAKAERDALIIQLLFGNRPQEAPCAEVLSTSVVIGGSWKNGRMKSLKTASNGVNSIIIARSKIIDAILLLTDCQPTPITTENAAAFFKDISTAAFGKKGASLDRYCLRHTALTWLVLSPGANMKQVGDMAGHMGARMLQDVYASRPVKDQRSWEDAMPLSIKHIPKNWHGFLLECFMISLWPGIRENKIPATDTIFLALKKILRSDPGKREELVLF